MPRSPLALLVAATALAGLAPASRAQTVPTGFTFELVIAPPFGGEPIGFEFLPDGRVVVIERGTGNVRLAAAGAATSVLIHTIPDVQTGGERGLLGVARDPAWPSRPYLYFSFARTDSQSVILMLEASGDLSNPASTAVALGAAFVLVEAPDNAPTHNGGTLRFGTDGMLYASLGEDTVFCDAQDLTSLRGKLLRLDVSAMPGEGAGPPPPAEITPADNPFVGHASENARLVWAWGLRNPFRFEVDPVTGDLFVGDPGSATWEEVDRIPASAGGLNLGWPVLEGPEPPPFMPTCGEENTFTPPIHYYPNPPEGPAAVIAGPLYRAVPGSDAALPDSYDGSYFFLEWGEHWIRRLVPGPAGWEIAPPVPGQPSADRWGEGFEFFSDFREGPDGALWLLKHGGAWGVYRIRRTLPTAIPAGGPVPPEASARPNPAPSGTPVEFLVPAGSADETLGVFDAAGRLVARLRRDRAEASALQWDGRDRRGAPLPAGVYFWRLERRDGPAAQGRITLLR
jgi:glucose/arabinose dehydrogenase